MKKESNYHKGIRYEIKAKKLFDLLKKPGVHIAHNAKIKGKHTKRNRQIDLLETDPEQLDYLILDCKNYSTKKIGAPAIQTLFGGLPDLGTKRCGIVSNSKFTKTAVDLANGINAEFPVTFELYSLVDTDDKEISEVLNFWHLRTEHVLQGISLIIGNEEVTNLLDINLTNKDSGERITANELARQFWNHCQPEEAVCDGFLIFEINDTNIELTLPNGDVIVSEPIAFKYQVKVLHHEALVSIKEARGIYDVRNKVFRSNKIIPEDYDAYGSDNKWQEVKEIQPDKKYLYHTRIITALPAPDGSFSQDEEKLLIKPGSTMRIEIKSDDGWIEAENILQ